MRSGAGRPPEQQRAVLIHDPITPLHRRRRGNHPAGRRSRRTQTAVTVGKACSGLGRLRGDLPCRRADIPATQQQLCRNLSDHRLLDVRQWAANRCQFRQFARRPPQHGAQCVAQPDQIGFLLRGGFFIAEDWELYGQYEWADSDVAGAEELSVLTIGVNKYWDKHNLKWQTDIGFGLNEVAAVFASDGAGWRTDPAGDEGQVVFRTQIQLLF